MSNTETKEVYYTEAHNPHVWKRGKAKPLFIADTYYSAKLAASELNRLSRPVTDAEIDAMFPYEKGMHGRADWIINLKREGAKALRDRLKK
jgi:hypothetical protein